SPPPSTRYAYTTLFRSGWICPGANGFNNPASFMTDGHRSLHLFHHMFGHIVDGEVRTADACGKHFHQNLSFSGNGNIFFHQRQRSEEHTSELQSRENLV